MLLAQSPSPVGFAADGEARVAMQRLRLKGLSIGVVRDGALMHQAQFGEASATYPIGSITKAFTATVLLQLVADKQLRLDDAVATYVPGTPAGITLQQLAEHTSGLPRIPANLQGTPSDPYGNYSQEALVNYLRQVKLLEEPGMRYSYSNTGFGLLGQALAKRTNLSYAALLQRQVLGPLQMKRTRVAEETAGWRLGALAPAGGLVSTVEDLAKFMAYHQKATGMVRQMQRVHAMAAEDWKSAVGLGWHLRRDSEIGEIVWHNGEVGSGPTGAHSWMGWSPKHRIGIIALTNTAANIDPDALRILQAVVKTLQPPAPALETLTKGLCEKLHENSRIPLQNLFHEMFLREIPPAILEQTLQRIVRERGECSGTQLLGDTVTFTFSRGAPMRAQVAADDGPFPLLTGLRFLN